jgi:hypothetical protein
VEQNTDASTQPLPEVGDIIQISCPWLDCIVLSVGKGTIIAKPCDYVLMQAAELSEWDDDVWEGIAVESIE